MLRQLPPDSVRLPNMLGVDAIRSILNQESTMQSFKRTLMGLVPVIEPAPTRRIAELPVTIVA
jgi:hypothetical protein